MYQTAHIIHSDEPDEVDLSDLPGRLVLTFGRIIVVKHGEQHLQLCFVHDSSLRV